MRALKQVRARASKEASEEGREKSEAARNLVAGSIGKRIKVVYLGNLGNQGQDNLA
jgi:hypothetical protein